MRTERDGTERGIHKTKDASAEHTHAFVDSLESADGGCNRLLLTTDFEHKASEFNNWPTFMSVNLNWP